MHFCFRTMLSSIRTRKLGCSHCGKDDFADTRPSTILRHENVCLSNPTRRLLTLPSGRSYQQLTRIRIHGIPMKCIGWPSPAVCTQAFDATQFPLARGVPSNTYAVVLIDPPFAYNRSVGSGVAANHYETLTDTQLGDLPLFDMTTRNAMLFFWCSGPTMNRAIALCARWGFVYKTVAFVWVKTNKTGKPQPIGLGSYTLPGTEMVLLATKGKAAPMVVKRVPQVVFSRRGKHSEKPEEFRTLIDAMTGNDTRVKKIELFSRRGADSSWSAWGDQLENCF